MPKRFLNGPEPCTYKPEEIKSKAQLFSIPKGKVNNFMQDVLKNRSFVPSPSAYEPRKADKIIT